MSYYSQSGQQVVVAADSQCYNRCLETAIFYYLEKWRRKSTSCYLKWCSKSNISVGLKCGHYLEATVSQIILLSIWLLILHLSENWFNLLLTDFEPSNLTFWQVTMWRECSAGDFTLATNALAREYVRHEGAFCRHWFQSVTLEVITSIAHSPVTAKNMTATDLLKTPKLPDTCLLMFAEVVRLTAVCCCLLSLVAAQLLLLLLLLNDCCLWSLHLTPAGCYCCRWLLHLSHIPPNFYSNWCLFTEQLWVVVKGWLGVTQ